eukprot:scaffold7115_cov125-Isochrysis_galbana.AAC.6
MEQLRAPEGALIVAGGSRRLCRWGFEGNRTASNRASHTVPNADRPWLCADVPISHAPRTLHGGVRLLRFAEFAGVQQTDVDHVSEQMQALELPLSRERGRWAAAFF